MVQGVVVQIRIAASFSEATGLLTIGNRTVTVVLVWSWYSISASASAVFSTGDHITGRSPRYSAPFIRKRPISPKIAASLGRSMVA